MLCLCPSVSLIFCLVAALGSISTTRSVYIHSFFNNRFILVRISENPELIPGILSIDRKVRRQSVTGHVSLACAHTHTHARTSALPFRLYVVLKINQIALICTTTSCKISIFKSFKYSDFANL